jgi:peptidyl-prolyl cis-trans isomerase A (cyclophilin A)
MIRRLLLLLAAALALSPATAQTPPAPPAPADVRVAIDTSAGKIIVAVHVAKAPITARNFLKYVDQKRFDGTTFYRAWGAVDYGFVQAGTQNDPKRTLPPIKLEPTTQTGLTHDTGALSMARLAPNTGAGDFFIVLGTMPGMNADPAAPGDNLGFAVFAHVVEGLDVVKAIVAAPKSATKGEGVMKGQILEPEIRILSAKRLP